MASLTLPIKARLLLLGSHIALETQLEKMSRRMGFAYTITNSLEELTMALSKVKMLVGVVICSQKTLALTLPNGAKRAIYIKPSDSIDIVLEKFDAFFSSDYPKNLINLFENTANRITSIMFGKEFGVLKRNLDFTMKATNLITCDSSADGLSVKISCEIDLLRFRQVYPKFAKNSDNRLVDTCSEICNQLLGVINAGIRPTGLNPLISLPIGVELNKDSQVVQVDFMPLTQFIDSYKTIVISMGTKIDVACPAQWANLLIDPETGSTEFL